MFLKLCAAYLLLALPVTGFSVPISAEGMLKTARKGGAADRHVVRRVVRSKAASPADYFGCYKSPADVEEENRPVYPVKELKDMLANRKAMLNLEGGRMKDYTDTLTNKLALPYCPEPMPESSLAETPSGPLHEYVAKVLEGTDVNKPLILGMQDRLTDVSGAIRRDDARNLQILSFICGFQRLGLENQFVFFTTDQPSALALRKLYPWLRVLWHDAFVQMMEDAGKRSYVKGNRIAKIVVSDFLVNMNREVLLADLDQYWVQDPIELLQKMQTPSGKLLDVAVMADTCWLTVNSGFVYYRPTNRTKQLLRYALNTKKFSTEHPNIPGKRLTQIADNDQYLLNCGFLRAASEGLNYVILPKKKFKFGTVNQECRDSNKEIEKYSVEAPMVWHTAGFSSSYERELDRFAVLGFVDVNASTGRCIDSRRGSEEDAQRANSVVSRMCKNGADGIFPAMCDCTPHEEPTQARSMLADFGRVPKIELS